MVIVDPLYICLLAGQGGAERLEAFTEADVKRMSHAQLIRWLTVAIQIERQVLGLDALVSPEQQETDATGEGEPQQPTIVHRIVSTEAEVAEARRQAAEAGATLLN